MSIEIRKAEDTWVRRIVKGQWTVPELFGDKTIYGELSFGGEKCSKLALHYTHNDIVDGVDVSHVIKLGHITGSCEYEDENGKASNVFIDIFNGFVSKISISVGVLLSGVPLQSAEVVASEVWCGNSLLGVSDENDICFDQVSFGIKGLEAWCGGKFYNSEIKPNNAGAIIDYSTFPTRKILEDSVVTVDLEYWWHGLEISLGQTEVSIAHNARVVIRPKSGKSLRYYGNEASYEHYQKSISLFFTLLIGDGAFSFGIRGQFGDWPHSTLFRSQYKSSMTKARQKCCPWSVFRLMKDRMPEIVASFVESFHDKNSELYALNDYINGFKRIDINANGELLFVFESLFDVVFKVQGNDYILKSPQLIEKQQVRDALLKRCCTDAERRIVKSNINITLNFLMKLDITVEECLKDFQNRLEQTREFWNNVKKRLKNERVNVAHSLQRDPFDVELHVALNRLIQGGLLWMIMRQSGFTRDEMYHVLSNDYDLCWVFEKINQRIG